jgi:inositol oxygenase
VGLLGYVARVHAAKATADFRDFAAEPRAGVREFYRQNHAAQTLAFAREKRAQFLPLRQREMSVWEAIEGLDAVVDQSDPDLGLTQLDHSLQTAEALRADGAPRWLVLTGFLHDLGKVLCLWGEPQWAVVGDTFPVGCAFDGRIVFPELFDANPDRRDPRLASRDGIYTEGCGLSNVLLSWGHDEYLYHVVKDHLPEPALAIIRYHSFYAWHREGAYAQLMDASDAERLSWVRRFNPYDLYSKSDVAPDAAALRPYYEALVAEFLPPRLAW